MSKSDPTCPWKLLTWAVLVDFSKNLHYTILLYTFVIPSAVETLGLWSPASLKVLRHIALRMTNRSGAGIVLACCHFIEQLSVYLWRHNCHMFLYHFSLLPVCTLWEQDIKWLITWSFTYISCKIQTRTNTKHSHGITYKWNCCITRVHLYLEFIYICNICVGRSQAIAGLYTLYYP